LWIWGRGVCRADADPKKAHTRQFRERLTAKTINEEDYAFSSLAGKVVVVIVNVASYCNW
jgi:hypothetical protein